MDIISFLLGKKSGGSPTPVNLQEKSITITENKTTNVTADTGYDGLSKVSVTTNVSGGRDWTRLGYSDEPKFIDDGYDYALEIKNNWTPATSLNSKFLNDSNLIFMPLVDTSTTDNMTSMFSGCGLLAYIPKLDTSKVDTMYSMFESCYSLQTIPQFDTSKVTTFRNMFRNCYGLKNVPKLDTSSVNTSNGFQQTFLNCRLLTNATLDNILQMCAGATSYNGTKTLQYAGITSSYYPASTIQALPHYQDFIDAGWTIGY